ncbi:radical SAM protein [Pseudothermotoga sp.]|uniref:elongator complex protein 3 n=1 Tax=Pseudothermotoga sp. TaxID=2033661 RepID=UPI0031F6A12C
MKILAVFLPNRGCKNKCVFCSQKAIVGSDEPMSLEELDELVGRYLTTTDRFEIAFYGGTFTALSREEQTYYLDWAEKYIRFGVCSGIRLSTRPDEIDEEKAKFLKTCGVSFVELGVQSFDDEVLKASGRGYTHDDVVRACQTLKRCGIDFGIHLMIGLIGDDTNKDILSAWETVKLGAKTCRIHPTLVLKDSPLESIYERGEYTPMNLQEAIEICSDMLAVLESHNVQAIRLGLYVPTELRKNIVAGPYHPRFGELVRIRLIEKVAEFLKPDIVLHTQKESSWVIKLPLLKVESDRFGFVVHNNFVTWKDALKCYADKLLQEVIACSTS